MITRAGHLVRRLGIVGWVLAITRHEGNRQRASRHAPLVREVGAKANYNGANVSREARGMVPCVLVVIPSFITTLVIIIVMHPVGIIGNGAATL